MKKSLLILYTSLCFLLFIHEKVEAQESRVGNASLSALNGAWDGFLQFRNGHRFREHSLYHDGFVTNISQDSTGAWKDTHSGTYEISGNLYKQKVLYSSNPDRIGIIHWQEFKIEGDTLYLTLFKKLINKDGKDVTSQRKPEMFKYVRAKL